MDILCLFPKPKSENKLSVVVTDQRLELRKATPSAQTTVTTVATIFVDYLTTNFGITSAIVTDSGL